MKHKDTHPVAREVLLMTATINVGKTPYVAISKPQERLFQYLCALIAWSKLTTINTIVFCENSNTTYDFSKIIEFSKDQGKILEVLVFNGNQHSQKQGKGYGEGKIIEYALKNSQYLNNEVNFYKITGRLFIRNFEQIRQMHENTPNVFKNPAWQKRDRSDNITPFRLALRLSKRYLISLRTKGGRGLYHPDNAVGTAFYKANVEFFKKNLLNSYKRVYDPWGYYLEHAYYDSLFNKNFNTFLTDYQMVGSSGTKGNLLANLDYSKDIKNLAKMFM